MHVRKHTRPSAFFRATETARGPGNEATPLELSNDVDFVDMIVKTTENTFQHSLPPYIMHVSHMIRVQPPLVVYGVIQ